MATARLGSDTPDRCSACGRSLEDSNEACELRTASSHLTNRKEVRVVDALLILALLVLIGPLSIFFGVDSRTSTDRGWVGAAR